MRAEICFTGMKIMAKCRNILIVLQVLQFFRVKYNLNICSSKFTHSLPKAEFQVGTSENLNVSSGLFIHAKKTRF